MNKRDLTDEDKKIIQVQQDGSPIVRFLRTKNDFNFSVGDYLIKQSKTIDEIWQTETISNVSTQPKRFLCIHEDEYGIKYLKPLTSLGKELPYVTQLTEVSAWTRYVVDPDYAEHIILDGENDFDFSEKRKQDKADRDAITRKNKKICEKMNHIENVRAIMAGLKPGDKIWLGPTIPKAVERGPVLFQSYTLKPTQWAFTNHDVMMLTVQCADGLWSMPIEDLVFWVIFKTEPFPYETV